MSSIDITEKEKKLLQDIAIKLHEGVHNPITESFANKKMDSYYSDISCNMESHIKEYSFESVVELKKELSQFWQDESYMLEFIPPVLAAAFKKRKKNTVALERNNGNNLSGEVNETDMLPTFIYNL